MGATERCAQVLSIVAPIFLVILIGYGYGRIRQADRQADKLINDYVLYVSLPALLFLAIAKANPGDLVQWGFLAATLAGILCAYCLGLILARLLRITAPQSSLIAMGSCYGTTGYMGIPILLSAFGSAAAVPAAIATILHNIPAIMAVIITHDIFRIRRAEGQVSYAASMAKALAVTISNPLTVAVFAGALFSVLRLPLPTVLANLAGFLGAAAGPTALFALGLSLARLNISAHLTVRTLGLIGPMIALKVVVQPFVTYCVALLLIGGQQSGNLWLITAIVMAGQPIGAGVYVFASKYEHNQEEISLAIIVSLIASLATLPLILGLMT